MERRRGALSEDECGIQALLDKALWGGAKGLPLEPLNLDMRIQKDWGAPEPNTKPGQSMGGTPHPARFPHIEEESLFPNPISASPPIRTTQPSSQPYLTARTTRGTPSPLLLSVHLLKKPVLAVFLLVLLCGLGLLSFTPPKITSPEDLMADVGRRHSEGDFQGALQQYAALRQIEGVGAGPGEARFSFLEAGAAESLWRKGIESGKNFALALQRYDEAIRSDLTPMRIYASEALMAKAEMNANKALASQPHDASAALIARQSLETLVESAEYSTSPVVMLGIAHRRLAELIRVENPQKAIDLLTHSKNRQGGISEGLEDLLIAKIYHDYLNDDERAYEFYSLVKTNPLASESNRRYAMEALNEIYGAGLQEPDMLDPLNLENLPQLKAD